MSAFFFKNYLRWWALRFFHQLICLNLIVHGFSVCFRVNCFWKILLWFVMRWNVIDMIVILMQVQNFFQDVPIVVEKTSCDKKKLKFWGFDGIFNEFCRHIQGFESVFRACSGKSFQNKGKFKSYFSLSIWYFKKHEHVNYRLQFCISI